MNLRVYFHLLQLTALLKMALVAALKKTDISLDLKKFTCARVSKKLLCITDLTLLEYTSGKITTVENMQCL